MEGYQIVIERERAFYGCALKHLIELDGITVGVLQNGQTLTIHTTVGNHILSFISHGKAEQIVSLAIKPEDHTTKLLTKINGRQKIEVTKVSSAGGMNTSIRAKRPVRQKGSPTVRRIIGAVLAIFLISGMVMSAVSGSLSEQSPEYEAVELTNEELAAVQLSKATEDFQSGDYLSAIEICSAIVSDYPDTEIAFDIDSYLSEQLALYPCYSAADLMREYDANIVNADEVYTDTVMVVTGTVSSIGKTNNDKNLAVMLKSGTYFYGVQLNFDISQTESVAILREGDTVSVVGKCSGKSGKQLFVFDGNNVMIDNCYLIGE